MNTLHAKAIVYRGEPCVTLTFDADSRFTDRLKQAMPLKWSATNRCWYCLWKSFNRSGIIDICEEAGYQYIEDLEGLEAALETGRGRKSSVQALGLSPANTEELERFRTELVLKAYSPSTIRTYTNEITQFLRALKGVFAQDITTERLRNYFQYCSEKLRLSEATLHSRINAVKFYYEQVLKREKFFYELPRPKKHQQLPKVLGERELSRLFGSVRNLKHKAILFTAYSAGLRVSEVVNLKLRDVDAGRMQLFIERAKGKKDRYVNLSVLLLDVLRQYIAQASPRPTVYLFESPQVPGEAYSIRAAQKIFSDAKDAAGIDKSIGFHGLRHSFATHMLEKGVDIRYIKDLLGHFNIQTTERYLHVRKEALINLPDLLAELNHRAAAQSLDAPQQPKKRLDDPF